jgi:hypothetical protein
MSQEQAIYEVEGVSPVVAGGVNFGKYWGAIRGEQVLAVMPMRVPSDVEFEHYRGLSQQALAVLGEVKSGELFEFEGKRFFVMRLTHANRSKKPRAPKVFEVREFRGE